MYSVDYSSANRWKSYYFQPRSLGLRGYYAKWNKSDGERQALFDNTRVKDKETPKKWFASQKKIPLLTC